MLEHYSPAPIPYTHFVKRLPLLSISLALFLFILFLAFVGLGGGGGGGAVEAADAPSDAGILAYTLGACPIDWTDVGQDGASSKFSGRLIKGWNRDTDQGSFTSAVPKVLENALPGHTHHGLVYKITFDLSEAQRCWNDLIFGGVRENVMMDWAQHNIHGSLNTVDLHIPRVTLRLCKYTSGPALHLPPGIVVFVDKPSASECPSGFIHFDDADGRFLVFASQGSKPSLDHSDGNRIHSPYGTPILTSLGPVGAHTHGTPAKDLPMKAIAGGFLQNPGSNCLLHSSTRQATVDVPLQPSHMNLPYVQLRACMAELDTAATNPILPHHDLIFYYYGSTCPPLYLEASTRIDIDHENIFGRVIFASGTDVTALVGSTFENPGVPLLGCAIGNCPPETPQAAHSHTFSARNVYAFPSTIVRVDGQMTYPGLPPDWCPLGACTNIMDDGPYDWDIATSVTAYADEDILPYRVMRACSPQIPTKSPTKRPTTLSPTVRPTRSPTMTSPSESPTMTAPSESPVYASPTVSPTNAPIWRDVCDSVDILQFDNYNKFLNQASRCWDACKSQLLSADYQEAFKCAELCQHFFSYSKVCRGCMAFWLIDQDRWCRNECMDNNKRSKPCRNCTDSTARDRFRTCTGMPLNLDQDNLLTEEGQAGAASPGTIAGATVGVLVPVILGVAAALVIYKRRKDLKRSVPSKFHLMRKAPSFMAASVGHIDLERQPSAKVKAQAGGSVPEQPPPESGQVGEEDVPEDYDGGEVVVLTNTFVQMLYDFEGNAELQQLSVKAGDTLSAYECNDEWYVCMNESTGESGLVPVSYAIRLERPVE